MNASQPRAYSLIESCVNVAIGFFINFFAQILIYPLFGFRTDLKSNFIIAVIFTVISIIRSYSLRRWFNFIHISSLK